MKIYLDDIRTPRSSEWTVCRSFVEFVTLISSTFYPYETPTLCDLEITFDHDLAPEHYEFDFEHLRDDPNMTGCEESGYDCAKWLIAQNIIPKMFWVHSSNPVGAVNILWLLNNWYKHNDMKRAGFRTVWELKTVETSQTKVRTPEAWKQYEKEARTRIINFQKTNPDYGFFAMLKAFSADVYNRGDGLVFNDFNERAQRIYLKQEFIAWMKELSDEITPLIN